MNEKQAQKKAFTATSIFALFFIVYSWYSVTDWNTALPLALFYILLLLNTYFSVKLFSQIIPKDNVVQNCLDGVIAIFYFLMPLTLQNPLLFYFLAAVFFMLACIKYDLLLGIIGNPKLLKRKLFVNILGSLGCVITLGIALLGYASVSWLFAGGFTIAHILVLAVHPIYRLD